MLSAGFARRDITPEESVPLKGYGDTLGRMSQVNLDPLYATCIAISDGEKTALLYHLDLTGVGNETVAFCRKKLGETYGIEAELLYLTATHCHSAPDQSQDVPCIRRFSEKLNETLFLLAGEAIADLTPAEMMGGTGKTKDLNFVRRYLLSDYSYGGDNFGDFKNNTILGHESEADNSMQVLRLVRRGKKDILAVNWQAHPHRTGGFRKFDLSSDLIEYFRQGVEKEGFLFAFFQGCSGNLNSHSRIREENLRQTPEYYDDPHRGYVTHGKKLAETCLSILPSLRPLRSGKLRGLGATLRGKVNHTTDALLPKALEVQALWGQGKSDEARALALDSGFHSVYHARAVIAREKLPLETQIPVSGMAMGDFAFVGAPNELYDTTGMYVKASSPFEMTFVCGCTNGGDMGGYLPTVRAFAHGGYGCDTCRFGPGIAEDMAMTLIGLLCSLAQ